MISGYLFCIMMYAIFPFIFLAISNDEIHPDCLLLLDLFIGLVSDTEIKSVSEYYLLLSRHNMWYITGTD